MTDLPEHMACSLYKLRLAYNMELVPRDLLVLVGDPAAEGFQMAVDICFYPQAQERRRCSRHLAGRPLDYNQKSLISQPIVTCALVKKEARAMAR